MCCYGYVKFKARLPVSAQNCSNSERFRRRSGNPINRVRQTDAIALGLHNSAPLSDSIFVGDVVPGMLTSPQTALKFAAYSSDCGLPALGPIQ